MITLPKLAAEALGTFLAADIKDRFGRSHARLAEIIPFVAQVTLECIGNSDALYHNVEHTMLVTLAGHDIFKGRALLTAATSGEISCGTPDCGSRRFELPGLIVPASADSCASGCSPRRTVKTLIPSWHSRNTMMSQSPSAMNSLNTAALTDGSRRATSSTCVVKVLWPNVVSMAAPRMRVSPLFSS